MSSTATKISGRTTDLIRTVLTSFFRKTTLYTCTKGRWRIFKGGLTSVFRNTTLYNTCCMRRLFIANPLLKFTRRFFRRTFTINIFHRLRIIQTFITNRHGRSCPFTFMHGRQNRAIFTRMKDCNCKVCVRLFRRNTNVRNENIPSIATFNINSSRLIKVILLSMICNFLRDCPTFRTRTLVGYRVKLMNSTRINDDISSNFIRDRCEIFLFRGVLKCFLSINIGACTGR